jgi:hypothetical protein
LVSFSSPVNVDYLFLGLNHRPPVTSEMTIKAIAAHENTVLSVARPRIKNTIPNTRKILEILLLFLNIEDHFPFGC